MNDIQDTIDQLRSALAQVERHEAPLDFLQGHGLQSRRFRFEWIDDALSMDFDLPCARVLAGDDAQGEDDAEIAAACRMAILLLAASGNATLLREGEARIGVACHDDGTYYEIRDAEGDVIDSSTDWGILAARLEDAFGETGPITIIYP